MSCTHREDWCVWSVCIIIAFMRLWNSDEERCFLYTLCYTLCGRWTITPTKNERARTFYTRFLQRNFVNDAYIGRCTSWRSCRCRFLEAYSSAYLTYTAVCIVESKTDGLALALYSVGWDDAVADDSAPSAVDADRASRRTIWCGAHVSRSTISNASSAVYAASSYQPASSYTLSTILSLSVKTTSSQANFRHQQVYHIRRAYSMRTRWVQFLKFWENAKQSLEVLQSISLYPDERFSWNFAYWINVLHRTYL